jgi:hypothetical protein
VLVPTCRNSNGETLLDSKFQLPSSLSFLGTGGASEYETTGGDEVKIPITDLFKMIKDTDLVHLEIQCSKVRMFNDRSQVARWTAKTTRLQKLTISDLFQQEDQHQLPWKALFDEFGGVLGALSWRLGSGDPDALDIDLDAIRRSI